MHELAIAEEMLRVAIEHAAREHADRITQFNIELVAGSDESEESLRFHLGNLTKGTIAQDARLEFARVPGEAKCRDCGETFAWDGEANACPHCGSVHLQLLSRDEIRLASIQVE